jgi:hypothetical protein
MASKPRKVSMPFSGIMRPVSLKKRQDQGNSVPARAKPKFLAAVSSTVQAAAVTARPMPSPGIRAIE